MSNVAFDTITECLADLTEDEALDVFDALRRRFGWAGTFFTRADAEQTWRESYPLSPGQNADDLEMPDDLWESVQDTWAWNKGLTELLTERGWDLVNSAVDEATGWEAKPELVNHALIEVRDVANSDDG